MPYLCGSWRFANAYLLRVMKGAFMSYSPYSIEERFSMITDCLQSVLTINMLCREHYIPTGTFYSWISQVKKSGYQVDDVVS